jgi:hypothetical protein
MGDLRKPKMDSDSRKAQRNSFAHHRAEFLPSTQTDFAGLLPVLTARPRERREPATRLLATAALARFLPAQAPALAAY